MQNLEKKAEDLGCNHILPLSFACTFFILRCFLFCFNILLIYLFYFQLTGILVKTKNICSHWEKNYVTHHEVCSSCGIETTLCIVCNVLMIPEHWPWISQLHEIRLDHASLAVEAVSWHSEEASNFHLRIFTLMVLELDKKFRWLVESGNFGDWF